MKDTDSNHFCPVRSSGTFDLLNEVIFLSLPCTKFLDHGFVIQLMKQISLAGDLSWPEHNHVINLEKNTLEQPKTPEGCKKYLHN